GVTFSLHRLLRAGSDDAVCLEAVLLLPGLDLGDRPGADLPVDLRADDLLHPGVVQPAPGGVAVAADVDEVPGLAVLLSFRPGPSPGWAVALEDFLDRARVNIHSKPGAVVGEARSCRIGALNLPPHRALVPAIRVVSLGAPVRPTVAIEEDFLLLFDGTYGHVKLVFGVRIC